MVKQIQRDHLSGYQRRDYEVIDYEMYELESTGLSFRGPPPQNLESGNYFTCIGAAQTFGCFCDNPYPNLLAEELGLSVLNLGYGGAGAEFFDRHDELAKYWNGGKFVILQVMSGRSQSNSLFDSRGLEYLVRRDNGLSVGAYAAYQDLLYGVPSFRGLPIVTKGFRRILPKLGFPKALSVPRVRRIVEETRRGWIESYRSLLSKIHVPVILFWFSERTPHYLEKYDNVESLMGHFPQLVNAEMVCAIRGLSDRYVECVSSRGNPQPLFSRFTGSPVTVDPAHDRPDLKGNGPWSHNTYYPSPEMHEDAASTLLSSCKECLTYESCRIEHAHRK